MVVIEAVLGDITADTSDAIVNAAHPSLLGGGGVDGAIHAAGGPSILRECQQIRANAYPDGLPTGAAVVTGAGNLPSHWVIHTVGPKAWEHPGGGPELLASCYRSSLERADEVGARSVAFPAVSCGVFGWDVSAAAPVAVQGVRDYAAQHPESGVQNVRFVLFSADALHAFADALSR